MEGWFVTNDNLDFDVAKAGEFLKCGDFGELVLGGGDHTDQS